MHLRIKAVDTLFFRDGRPFTAGEESWAETIFPPFPTVLYGALRSAYFAENPQELKLLCAGEKDPTASLVISGFNLLIETFRYYSLPKDCLALKEQGEDSKEAKVLRLQKVDKEVYSNYPFEYCLVGGEGSKEIEDGYVSKDELAEYLNGSSTIFYEQLQRFICREPKIGIMRSRLTGAAKEEMLYQVEMLRTATTRTPQKINVGMEEVNVDLEVEFSGFNLAKNGIMRFGGEGKAAAYQASNQQDAIPLPDGLDSDSLFKLVLTTPAIFEGKNNRGELENRWYPGWLNENFCGTIPGTPLKVKLIAAAIGRPLVRGGFDLKNKKPKPAYRVIPEGSVFYFAILEKEGKNKVQESLSAIHGRSISDCLQEAGLGLCYVGRVNCNVKQ